MNILRKTIRNIKKKIKAAKDLKMADKVLTKYLQEDKGKRILLVTHMLTKTGGSLITFNKLLYNLLKKGYNPFVLAYDGGNFTKELEKLNVNVILGEVFQYDKEAFLKIANNFETIIANSVVTCSAVDWRNDAVWWIQEGQNVEKDFMTYLLNLDRALNNANKIFVVSEYAKDTVIKYNKNCEVINLGVKDYSTEVKSHKISDKIKFMTVGEINDCKAQDVLMNAIQQLDKKYLDKSEFHLIFNIKKGHRYRNLNKIAKKVGNVFYQEVLTNQLQKSQVFEDMDVFIVPSRDESCSLVTLEACMLSKPVIVTENVGAKYMIQQGKNGYIVKTADVEDLKTAIEKIIDNKQNLEEMGKISRELYEKNANEKILEDGINRIIEYVENM